MDGIAKFFAMGGYAVYVWPALGLTALVMIALAWASWRGLKQEERAVASLEQELKARAEAETASEAEDAS